MAALQLRPRRGASGLSGRRLRLRYPAECSVCRIELSPKTEAFWDGEAQCAICLACGGDANIARDLSGIAGGSALAKAQEL
jgi:hypothetical protein